MTNSKNGIRIGSQTFIWEMAGAPYPPPDVMVREIANAGYEGIEITDNLIGDYFDNGPRFHSLLRDAGLTLVAFTISSPSGFTLRRQIQSDLRHVQRSLEFLQSFPGAFLTMGSATRVSSDPLDDLFAIAAEIYNAAGSMAAAAGHRLCIHASSHENTILLTEDDYRRILEATDSESVGWVPDTGHMQRVGQDLIQMLRAYRDRIEYIHLKDVDKNGVWAMLGQGSLPLEALINFVGSRSDGEFWLVVEEESEESQGDRAAALRSDYTELRRAANIKN